MRQTLSNAIALGQFKPYMQFIYNEGKQQFTGAEILSRWHHPEKGVLPPSFFLDAMFSSNVIDQFDFQVFENICAMVEKWEKKGLPSIIFSCNFTRITISSKTFFDRFKAIYECYQFCHDRIAIEITEDAFVKDKETAYENVMRIREAGFRIALDDMGSGYTSICDLCDYPFNIIKLDRRLTLKALEPRGKVIISGVLDLIDKMGAVGVCEGIETAEQRQAVLDCGCKVIQGFYYSRVYSAKEAFDLFIEGKTPTV